MNILVLSCGSRNKIIHYFKRELKSVGMVMATDCSRLAPALYDADKYFIVPSIGEESYLETILTICTENRVNAVFSLIDPELSLLARHKDEFLSVGTVPIISDYDTVEMCFDKYLLHNFLIKEGYKTAKTYISKEVFYRDLEKGRISFPVFLKPRKGSASLNISVANEVEELETIFKRHDDLLIQEYMHGTEYGADVYIDMISRKPVSIFIKEKIKMRAGETDKSVSIKDKSLFDLISDFVTKAKLVGVVDIDIFKIDNEYYISEVNPRFGGGYPHAYECGVNFPKMIINNIKNIVNSADMGSYDEGVYMMKYNEVKIVRG
ncbi:MAG TPA: ATP-grasp domain-containing protein [Clostridiaceae bacterium]|nr:ATP-grasp domain-containing protein [Clostridiaceae bacterium]